ncbi:MAG: GNAT family N-acetyltransferase [Leifsonia sp.]
MSEDQWMIVAWLWQAFRQDLSPVVNGLPYSDGRYQTAELQKFPSPDRTGYIAWRPHPNTGEDAPVAFALVDGLQGPARGIAAFWVAPPLRREGLGRLFAREVLGKHDGPWRIGFQHENGGASAFWRNVADEVFGPNGWSEGKEPVPGKPDVPPDHFIVSIADPPAAP